MRLNIYNSLMGLCVAAAAVSCSNELVDSDLNHVGGEETGMISFVVTNELTRGGSFGNRPGTSTRGEVVNGEENMDKIAVYGNYDNSSNKLVLFNGTEVQNNNGTWTYSDTRYWFKGEYNFAAIYPASANAIKNLTYTDNSLSFTYSPADYTESEDILTATHHRFYESGETSKVAFDFNHIFSRINFVAKVDPTSSKSFVIERLVLKNVSTSGTYTITPASTTTETNDFYSAWTDVSASNGVLFDYQTSVEATPEKSYSFFPDSQALMLIPQAVDENIEVEITYYPKGDKGAIKTVPANLYLTTAIAHNAEWLRGKTYSYSFTLGDNESIIFNNPTIQSWNEAEGGNYIVTDKDEN